MSFFVKMFNVKKIKEMNKVNFLPFVGKNYTKGICGKRVMVLGQSHYCDTKEEAVPEITNNVIQWYTDDSVEFEGWMNTYTKFIRALSGEAIARAESAAWWDKVLFYNYVQVPMSAARIKPMRQDFASSEVAFFEVLEQYQPNRVLVWSKADLYDELPRKGYQCDDLVLKNGDAIETWAYELSNGKQVQLLPITHPAAGFTPEYWHEAITLFIQR